MHFRVYSYFPNHNSKYDNYNHFGEVQQESYLLLNMGNWKILPGSPERYSYSKYIKSNLHKVKFNVTPKG